MGKEKETRKQNKKKNKKTTIKTKLSRNSKKVQEQNVFLFFILRTPNFTKIGQ